MKSKINSLVAVLNRIYQRNAIQVNKNNQEIKDYKKM
jgi:hypothetical protein